MNKKYPKFAEKKIIFPDNLSFIIEKIKEDGHTIATLNGSFDLLHAGHLHIIYEASLQADILLVALNTDSSIQRYKSPERPIIELPFRLTMMAALEFVDIVTWFDEETPCTFLEKVRPDVHVNGSEYGSHCIEANIVKQYGGKIHIVDLIPGLSTSEVIEKIKK